MKRKLNRNEERGNKQIRMTNIETVTVDPSVLEGFKQKLLMGNVHERIDVLEKMFALLGSRGKEQLAQTMMQHVGLPLLFQQLDTTSEQQLESAVRVCQKLLNLMPKEVIEQILSDPSTSALLEIGSKHGYESVRALVLEQMARLDVKLLFSNVNYVAIVARGLMDQSMSVSKLAGSIILSWVQSIHEADALRLMFDANSSFLSILQQGMKSGEVIRLRIYELFANISSVSENTFNSCVSTSILDQFVQDVVHSEDNVLTLLNLLEIAKKFCSSRYIIEWMHKKGLFSSIIKILIDHEEDELISSFIFHLVADVSDRKSVV